MGRLRANALRLRLRLRLVACVRDLALAGHQHALVVLPRCSTNVTLHGVACSIQRKQDIQSYNYKVLAAPLELLQNGHRSMVAPKTLLSAAARNFLAYHQDGKIEDSVAASALVKPQGGSNL